MTARFTRAWAPSCHARWMYWEVGKKLAKCGSSVSGYQRWIDTYASTECGSMVQQVIALVDRLADALTAEDKKRMAAHCVMTSRFAYLFWDMGYRCQTWEV